MTVNWNALIFNGCDFLASVLSMSFPYRSNCVVHRRHSFLLLYRKSSETVFLVMIESPLLPKSCPVLLLLYETVSIVALWRKGCAQYSHTSSDLILQLWHPRWEFWTVVSLNGQSESVSKGDWFRDIQSLEETVAESVKSCDGRGPIKWTTDNLHV